MNFLIVVLALSGLLMQSVHGDTCDVDNVLKCAEHLSNAAMKLERKGLDVSKEDLQEFCREATGPSSCLENLIDKCQRSGSESIKDMIKTQSEIFHKKCAELDGAVSIRSIAPMSLLLVALIPVLGLYLTF